MKNSEKFYYIVLYLLYLLYFMAIIGFQIFNLNHYINVLNLIIRIYVCGFLIYRFNPFYKLNEFSDFDRQIVFTSSIFLFITLFASNVNYILLYLFEYR